VTARGSLHHVEVWCRDVASSGPSWDWLLGAMGFVPRDTWRDGRSWPAPDGSYVVLESGPDVVAAAHERRRPGVNHLAFRGGSRDDVDGLVADAPSHGWALLFADRHPFAGGPEHYAAYLEDSDGFEVEVEVVADGDA
jgi:hypothetical protein